MNPNFFNLAERKKRNILSELLVDKSPEGIISKKEINAVNKIIKASALSKTAVTVNKQQEKTEKKHCCPKKKSGPKRKKTHYLTQDISENLDMAQLAIRSYVPVKLRSEVSKSHIVNQALAMVLFDFRSKGKNSLLMRSILKKL